MQPEARTGAAFSENPLLQLRLVRLGFQMHVRVAFLTFRRAIPRSVIILIRRDSIPRAALQRRGSGRRNRVGCTRASERTGYVNGRSAIVE